MYRLSVFNNGNASESAKRDAKERDTSSRAALRVTAVNSRPSTISSRGKAGRACAHLQFHPRSLVLAMYFRAASIRGFYVVAMLFLLFANTPPSTQKSFSLPLSLQRMDFFGPSALYTSEVTTLFSNSSEFRRLALALFQNFISRTRVELVLQIAFDQ